MNRLSILTKGIIKENPVLVLLLGLCPSLAVTTTVVNGIGMGVSTMIVLLGSNIVVSLLRNVIPDKVRIPCFIVVIAGFVTIVGFLVKAYAPDIDKALGLFLPLIVVNCVILGRAEMFASKNGIINSALDAIGMGIGFTLSLAIMGAIRELMGSGELFGISITSNFIDPMSVFMLAPGGFFVFGILVAVVNKVSNGKAIKKKEIGCAHCPAADICLGNIKGEEK